MDKDEHIKKLARRIHNQRVALRENWEIVEMRRKEYCGTLRPLRSKWWGLVMKQNQHIRELKEEVERWKQVAEDAAVANTKTEACEIVESAIEAHKV